jgi:glutamine amidotransferase
MISIVDYGAGNLRSVCNAIAALGYEPKLAANPEEVLAAEALIFPGVGAAASAMEHLKKQGLDDAIREYVKSGRYLLGVCLGLQLLLAHSEEDGRQDCLNIVPGVVKKLPGGQKIPHMGWNQVRQRISHPIFEGIADGDNFYFVHSYYACPDDEKLAAGETDYSVKFCSVLAHDNLIATQFHPEKSGSVGLRIYQNFIRLAKKC